jgi:glycosyltransferase involved in cell wall biosynthesis
VKKIIILSLAYFPHVGGAEVAIKEITDRITDIEFHMITLRMSPTEAAQERVGNIMVHRVGKGSSYFSKMMFIPRAARAVKELHGREQFDGAWAMMSYMVLPLVLAKLPIPYALTLQEGDTYSHMFARLRILPFLPLLRRGFRGARVVSALSTFLAQWAKRMGYKGDVAVIPNGADVQKFAGSKIAHQGVVLITSSRLVHKNAVDDVLRALVHLPEVTFKIAGSGPDEVKLKALAHQLGVADRVEWLGHVDHADLPATLHAADIFVRPSRSEGFGASFAEAFAAELPVIATQEGGLKDFITKDVAWPVRRDAPNEIAEAVKAILGNPLRSSQVVENARRMVF